MARSNFRVAFILVLTGLAATAAWTTGLGCDSGKTVTDGGLPDTGGTDGGTGDGGVTACKWLSDCPMAECVNGACVKAERCRCDSGDKRCQCAIAADGSNDCKVQKICYEQRWVNVCTTDLDCPDEGFCMNGICELYKFKMDYPEPNKGGTKGTLKAGYGEVMVDFPVGVSMAGFGARKGPKTPYALNLGGSTGFHDRPTAKAVVLDNGVERIVFIRNATSWSTDYSNTMVASKLAEIFKENYLNKMVSSDGHSHSFPARFWTAAYATGMGAAGSDDFMWEIFDRLTTSYAKAIEQAVNNLAPAKFSYSFSRDFDPTGMINGARSTETFGPDKDKDFLVMRIDHAGGPNDGKTMAVVMRYASHGTILRDTFMTGDAQAGAEYGAENGFERDLGYHVPVVCLNGNMGNTSPRGGSGPGGDSDGLGRDDYQRVQGIGYWIYPMVKTKYDEAVNFSSSPSMKMVSRFIPLDRKSLGYKDDEFYDQHDPDKVTYWNGAMMCVNGYKVGGYTDGALGCVLDVTLIGNGAPFPEINKLRTSAVRIDDLVLLSLPGEPTNPFGKKVVAEVQKATGLTDVFTIGVSQDHQFYLVNSDDWWKGSYEANMDIWGWKFGDFVAQYIIENGSTLKDPATAKDLVTKEKYSWYEGLDSQVVTPIVAVDSPGFFVQPPATVTKYDVVTAQWHGGDPGTGGPRIFLEKQDGGTWATAKTAGGADYDDTHFHMFVEYPGYDNKDYFKGKHNWKMTWQEIHMFNAGTYRFRVEGFLWDGSKKAAYTVTSNPFVVKDIENIAMYGFSRSGGNLVFKARYPVPPADSIRLHSGYSPALLGAPLAEAKTVAISVTCAAQNYVNGAVPVVVSTDKEALKDANNQTWNVAYTTVAFPDFTDKTCEYNITLTDPWGNKGTYKALIP
jgi:hypothetical protein